MKKSWADKMAGYQTLPVIKSIAEAKRKAWGGGRAAKCVGI